jgi:hypothetical protein
MRNRHPNPRLVKIHRSYSVEEIARLFGLHTVRNWLKKGLALIDDRRPMLVLGQELLQFLHERRQRAKQACGRGRIYCIACCAPKLPAGKMAECVPTGPQTGNLRDICPDCDRLIYQRVNPAKIDAARDDPEFHVHAASPAQNYDGRKLIILYLGDYDPPGLYMSQIDLLWRIAEYGCDHVTIHRIALTHEQVSDLPSFPATDKGKGALLRIWASMGARQRRQDRKVFDLQCCRALLGETGKPSAKAVKLCGGRWYNAGRRVQVARRIGSDLNDELMAKAS